ncbi:polysaccharide deacetylase family protein [Patescibacteria group bacterium]|nr:polysaccharide deacetylase family protein [Patescibacteria group bacterium]
MSLPKISSLAKFWWFFVFVFFLTGVAYALFINLHSSRQSTIAPIPKGQPIIKKHQDLSYVTHGSRHSRKIALTFDADMTPFMVQELQRGEVKSWYNQAIVDYLDKEKIPATIFMAGMWAELYPEVAKSLAQNPLFEIANHSYSHPRFTSACFALPPMPAWGPQGEFEKSQAAIFKATGITPQYFRFPGGCQTKEDIKLANSYGLTVVGWDNASGDSFNSNEPAIINTVETRTQNGSILLFHFHGNRNAPETAKVLPIVIPYLRAKGFEFVKLSDLDLQPN